MVGLVKEGCAAQACPANCINYDTPILKYVLKLLCFKIYLLYTCKFNRLEN